MADENQPQTIQVHNHRVIASATPDDLAEKLDEQTREGFSIVQVCASEHQCWVVLRKIEEHVVQPRAKPVAPQGSGPGLL